MEEFREQNYRLWLLVNILTAKLRDLSPQPNSSDRKTAACRRS
jgi:hypothetical protein